MKKQIIIYAITSALLLGISINAKSQDLITSGGIKGGLTMSNLYINENELEDENARFGFHLGFFSKVLFAETFGIQPEILFTNKGTSATFEGLIDQTVDFNLNYVDIPVMLVYRPLEIVEVHAGPYIGFLINSNIKYTGLIDGENELDRDNFNTIDYGIAAGLEFNFGTVKAGLRYNIGLKEVAFSTVASTLLGDSKHSYGQVYIAFGIPRRY
jgi:hypothetical protein